MSPSLSSPRLTPPSGVNYHCVDEVPIADLTRALQRVVAFLQDLDLAHRARLLRFADWWQHDGLHFYQGEMDMHALFAMVESPRALLAAAIPSDDYVRVGVAPEDSSWYLRFYADWTENGWALVGNFDVTIPANLAPQFRESVVPDLGVPVAEETAETWNRSIIQ